MHLVGIRNGSWILITDGVEVFIAEEDVRGDSNPPQYITGPYMKTPLEVDPGRNRITAGLIGSAAIDKYCLSHSIQLQARAAPRQTLLSRLFPWFSLEDEFDPRQLAKVFADAKNKCEAWTEFDVGHERKKAREIARRDREAREKWIRYHKLRDLASVESLSGREFEMAIVRMYERLGYAAKLTPASGDYGVDVIAEKQGERLAIQAKRYAGNVGVHAVQEVSSGAKYYKATKALVITNSKFTGKAKLFAADLDVVLVGRDELAEMWGAANNGETPIPAFDLDTYQTLEREICLEFRELDRARFPRRRR